MSLRVNRRRVSTDRLPAQAREAGLAARSLGQQAVLLENRAASSASPVLPRGRGLGAGRRRPAGRFLLDRRDDMRVLDAVRRAGRQDGTLLELAQCESRRGGLGCVRAARISKTCRG